MPHDPIEDLRRYGHALRDHVEPAAARRAARLAIARVEAPRGLSWRRRLVTSFAALAVFGGGNAGLALAADSAVPGDFLYGVDRAYERIAQVFGLEGGDVAERLAEVQVLVARGDLAGAIELALEALRATDDVGEVAAVVEALESLGFDEEGNPIPGLSGNKTGFDEDGTPPGLEEPPPGQGGTPPGQDETPPGLEEPPPGLGEPPPGQGGTTPGQNETPPGGTAPGRDSG